MDFTQLYEAQVCPVCGFKLDFIPWSAASEIEQHCLCCGMHFGVDDVIEVQRWEVYDRWHRRWVDQGMRWWSTRPRPSDFNPSEQLARLQGLIEGRAE